MKPQDHPSHPDLETRDFPRDILKCPSFIRDILKQYQKVEIDSESRDPLLQGAAAAIGFLIGKGLEPQEVYEVLTGWWKH